MKTYIHLIEESSEATLVRTMVSNVPRPGDEIRIAADIFYRVTRVVWVFDEPDSPWQRANIGVEKVDE